MSGTTEAASASLPFTIVTFNVRLARANDGPNGWSHRAQILTDTVRGLDPDILSTQEPYIEQIESIAQALPDHRRIGVGRDDGREAGEWSAIFVRGSRFTVIAEGSFWFSETPGVAGSRSWDAPHHPRLCTWALLGDQQNDDRPFLVYNSHWDNEGAVAREHSAALIAERLSERPPNVPAIVTGDFNCTPRTAPIRYLTGLGPLEKAGGDPPPSPRLRDAWAEAHTGSEEPSGTFHGFVGGANGDRIDYILLTDAVEALSCEIIRTNRDGRYPSDHFPVRARLRI